MNQNLEGKTAAILSVDPIIMSMDFLRNPVFLPTNEVPDDFDGNFFVKGELKTTLKGASLIGDTADVFHALTHLASRQNFAHNKVSFVLNDLHKMLKLSRQGNSYLRVKKAIESLYNVSIEIQGVNLKSGKMSGGWRILTARSIYENKEKTKRNVSQSWVKFSDEMIELFRSGALKAVHPIYFELPEFIDRRLFSLISVRASDLKSWDVSVLTLKDLIPLLGNKKYKTPSGIIQQLEKNLNRMKKIGVIEGFEVIKLNKNKDPMVAIRPNSSYYISKSNPIKKAPVISEKDPKKERTANALIPSKLEDPVVKQLMSYGISSDVALDLVFSRENGLALAKLQIAYLEFKMKQGQGPKENIAGWLIQAIRTGYAVPPNAENPVEKEKKQKVRKLLDDAEFLFFQEEYEAAREKAEELVLLGVSDTVLSRISKIIAPRV